MFLIRAFLIFAVLIFSELGLSLDFAIYAPHKPGDGVWAYEVYALEKAFVRFGFTYKEVNFEEIRNGILGAGENRNFHGFVMPGGPINPRVKSLGLDGSRAILNFIKSGGNYVGFCGGSYYAGAGFVWAESATGENGAFYNLEDYKIFQPGGLLSVFSGLTVGPFQWTPYQNGNIADGLEEVRLNTNLPDLNAMGAPETTKLFYYGGPFFRFTERPANLEVWAKAIKPREVPEQISFGSGQPTVVHFQNGTGSVILFSYHPSVILGGAIDGVQVESPYQGHVVRVDPIPYTLGQINYQSWNLLHGALQLTADQSITPLNLQ